MHDYLTEGFTANTSLAHYCRDNGLLINIHRAMHAVIDRQKNHGRDLAREGNEIIRSACKWSPELAAACEVWKAIKFEFEPVDKLDS
uniref:Ribulose bisphosphate carboxylase large subunit C-terminal domain-containing protein n=1 Tax=Oryza rufipogon TaxID=4529 RepID=A0A0E0R997_ORYRU